MRYLLMALACGLGPCVLAAWATPAAAQDAVAWGSPFHPTSDGPNTVRLELCDDASCFARVVVRNTLISGAGAEEFSLNLEGLSVGIHYDGRASMLDDVVTVTPPPGFTAIPEELIVPENGSGVILILLAPLS